MKDQGHVNNENMRKLLDLIDFIGIIKVSNVFLDLNVTFWNFSEIWDNGWLYGGKQY